MHPDARRIGRNEADHDDGQGTRGPRNHAGTPADQRGDQTNDEGRVKAHQRCDSGDEGKGHGFGHQGQRHGQAGQHLDPQDGGGQDRGRRDSQIGPIETVGKSCQQGAAQG